MENSNRASRVSRKTSVLLLSATFSLPCNVYHIFLIIRGESLSKTAIFPLDPAILSSMPAEDAGLVEKDDLSRGRFTFFSVKDLHEQISLNHHRR